MPWKYVMPNDVESLQRRESTVQRITAWWDEFVRRLPTVEAHLAGTDTSWDLPAWMNERLATIHPRLRWEFGQDLGGRYLVITPETAHHLRPMTDTLIRRAPDVPGWSFREYRAAQEPEDIPPLVKARTGHIMGTTTVQAKIGHHRQIDFVFQSLLAGQNEVAALRNARAALEYLIGEDVAQRWAGHVDVVEISHGLTQSFVPLVRVRTIVLDLISTILTDLPDRPYWRMPKLAAIESKYRPERVREYANQDDAMFGHTVMPELREAAFKPGFCSCRFSRQGETFCYLKIDASDVELEERYKRKKMVEESMDTELRENGIGAVVGSATGRKYIYVDLAVVDVVKTLELVRRRLLALEALPVRSWLLFYDADLAGEYIGLRSATPQPPLWAEPVEAEATAPPTERPGQPGPVGQSPASPASKGSPDDPAWMMDPLR
jgi:hypothetical protein